MFLAVYEVLNVSLNYYILVFLFYMMVARFRCMSVLCF